MSKSTTSAAPSLRIRWATTQIESESRPGTFYTVALDAATGRPFDCTCPDASFRRKRCKHQRAVLDGKGSKPRVRAIAIPPENITVHDPDAFNRYVARAASSVASVADLYGE